MPAPIIEVTLQPDARSVAERIANWAWSQCGGESCERPGFGVELIVFTHADYGELNKRVKKFRYDELSAALDLVRTLQIAHPTARLYIFGFWVDTK